MDGLFLVDVIEKADSACNNDSNKPDSNSYKAMIVDGAFRRACVNSNCTDPAENLDWVFKPNTDYYRVDGTYLFTTNSAGIVSEDIASPILEASKDYWTGVDYDWHPHYNCSGWYDNTSSSGIFGRSTSTNNEWYSYPSSIYCSSSFHLLCVEQ